MLVVVLLNVSCLVYTFVFSRLVSWWIAALYLAILRPLRNPLLHRDSKCSQVSMSLIWHNMQLGLVCVCGYKRFLLDLPMHWRIRTCGVV